MKRKLSTMVALVLLVVSALWPASAAAAPPSATAGCNGATIVTRNNRVPMCGTTIITASASRVVRLVVPHTVRLTGEWVGRGKAVEIAGTGAFSGFALVQDLATGPGETVLTLGLLPPDAFPSNPHARYTIFPGPTSDGSYVIPRGRYLLYLLSDGSPVRLTFRLPGLPGTARYRPTRAAQATVQRLTPYVATGPTGVTYAAGATHPLYSEGLLFQAQWLRVQIHTQTTFGSCYYEGEPPLGPEAFLPGCPAAGFQGIITLSYEAVDGTEFGEYGYALMADRESPENTEPRPFGAGGYTVSGSAPVTYDAVAVWLSYR